MTPEADTADDSTDPQLTDGEIVDTRSEIVFLMDAEDANPNGDPLSPSNKPRTDPVTGQGIVTDVRLKRYLRDELAAQGKGVYIKDTTTEDGNYRTRDELAALVKDVDSPDDIGEGFAESFLQEAVDVRYFGALFSFETSNSDIAEALSNHLPSSHTGPVQISPGRSLHRVRANEGYNSLTSVISNSDSDAEEGEDQGKETGGYQLDDHRIVYGLYGFSAVVNENSAEATRLTKSDVEQLDSLFWKGVKNQANSRSKRGQHPRLYVRVEYESGFHVGNLDRTLDLGAESDPADELTDVHGVTVDVTEFVDQLQAVSGRIDTVHILQDTRLDIEADGDVLDETLPDHIENEVDASVDRISLYD